MAKRNKARQTIPPNQHSASVAEPVDIVVKRKIKARFWRALHYLSIFAYQAVISIGALTATWVVSNIAWFYFGDTLQANPTLVAAGDFTKSLLALIALTNMIVKGCIDAWGQVQLDYALSLEGGNET